MQTETQNIENESNVLKDLIKTMVDKIDNYTLTRGNKPTTLYAPLSIYRYEAPTELTSYVQEPAVCLIAQGHKRVVLGDDEYLYDQDHYLITSIDLPVSAQILEASKDKPYLGLTLRLEKKQIAQMMLNDHLSSSRNLPADRALAVSRLDLPLTQAFHRLIQLLEHPQDVPVLGPLVQEEIVYRLLTGEQGKRLQQMTMIGSHSHQIARAIEWLKQNFDKSFKIDELAALAGMSTSSLHYHFRAVTAMTPLQFQKKLRLNEARQRMLLEQKDATTAAFEVGYESPSQFSREYSRLFGAPPSRDIKRILATTTN
ncbi:AraC family transcriptional regulator [Desulfogranum japonicum]|uniref:AraC family transcriptional regulator n=1 Tax=Desulfogranum japonicum TaxID=231447 RepID=UPI00040CA96C|nr:AraC family transcriptional regulator [Desulfogranum japonicum]